MTVIKHDKIMKAAFYIINGCSLKDVLNDEEIEQAILILADIYYCTGIPNFNPDEVNDD